MTPASATVLIVDDHPIVREGIAQLLSAEPGIGAVLQAASSASARSLMAAHTVDMIILDISLAGESGLDFLASLRAAGSKMPVLVLSMYDEAVYAERVLQAGAQGYLMKQSAAAQVTGAVLRILAGEIVVSPTVQNSLLVRLAGAGSGKPASAAQSLSDRELDVLRLIGEGLSTAEIASALHRSTKTIETHRAALKAKLSLKSGLELVHYAARWGAQRENVP